MIVDGIELEDVACPACGSRDGTLHFVAPAYASNHRDLRFPYRRCAGCGAVYASPRIPEAEAGRFYTPDYHPARTETERLWKGLAQLAILLQMGLRDPGRLLDWGAGGGELVRVLRALGMDAWGFDAYADPRTEHFILDEETARALTEVRVVTMLDTFEHLFDPVGFLRKLGDHRDLAVYVFAPRGDGAELRRFGPDAYVVQAPTHVFLPTERSLLAIAARAGWTATIVSVPATDFREPSWQLRLGGRAFAAQGPRGLRERVISRIARLDARLAPPPAGAHIGAVFRPAGPR
jgi:hypothetical protein